MTALEPDKRQERSRGSTTAIAGRARDELRAPRAAGVAGILFAALLITSLFLVRESTTEAPNESTLVLVGLYGIPFAGIAFLWFIGVVRDRIGVREDRLFATVFLGSGLLFVAMIFAAAATSTAWALRTGASASAPPLSDDVAQYAAALTHAFLYVYAIRTAGVFVIATSTITLATSSVPRWIGILGYIVAVVLLLSRSYFEYLSVLFPLWVGLLSLFVLVRPLSGEQSSHT